ncbi:MAG: alpha/beta hydrolase [Tannerellaceae bacterium]|nr:alpha/beta hydrolase [Tannerellaceae bacterium]
MKRIVLIILAFGLFTIASNAQTVGFNHKTGKYLEVDGANIYCEEIENAGKPTLLFLHGGFGNIEDFNSILPMFADDYHIAGIDSRGHGKSTLGTGKLTYKRLQLDVEAVVNHLQLKDIDIIGFSDGGIIAYRLAAANRIPVRKIVTVGATWSLSDAELVGEIMDDLAPDVWKAIVDSYQLHNPEPDVDRPVERIVEMWTDKTEDGYPLESVENITVPTLIIRGNDDNSFPLESAVELAAKIKKSALFNIPFAPHDAHNKYPQFFEAVTKEFLNKREECGRKSPWTAADKALAGQILQDTLMNRVEAMALEVIKGGFNAGDGYGEVWIRDYNTFIEAAMQVMPDEQIQENLLAFFRFQGPDGDIPDGFINSNNVPRSEDGYYRFSELEPRCAAHKNTVETDQESSLVQAVYRYVAKSGNRAFLRQEVGGITVLNRLEKSLLYLLRHRFDAAHGLLWGATTADWGDVQPEHPWGVALDEHSHPCLDIYDNAFFIIAINHFIILTEDEENKKYWAGIRNDVIKNVKAHLWDSRRQKFIPHVYLDGSPFPEDFDESAIYYHGGTAMAIEAGLLSHEEIATANAAMLANVKASGAPTIGLTVYPPYPEGFFLHKGMYPYGYQNGGDWTWFGGRMIRQLACHGFAREAYDEIYPMLERVVKNNGFYEWYTRDGQPAGSGAFRGEAGVLYKAIEDLRRWARLVKQ